MVATFILGISAFYHDSAATLTVGGTIIAAAQEERFTRAKHTPDFPVYAIKYCLEEGGLEIDELDAIVFYDKPLLKFERLLVVRVTLPPWQNTVEPWGVTMPDGIEFTTTCRDAVPVHPLLSVTVTV